MDSRLDKQPGEVVRMIRSFFFAAGLYIVTCGLTCLLVDQMTLNWRDLSNDPAGTRAWFTSVAEDRRFVLNPPDWLAFSLMTVGSVTTLYSIALPGPRRMQHQL